MITPKFTAIRKGDRVKVLDEQRFRNYVSGLPEHLELVLFPLRKGRSYVQNRYYWGVVLKIISDETDNSVYDMHEYLKTLFLKKWIIVKGQEVETVRSTTALNTKEFEEYLEQCRQWASMELGIFIPLPNDAEY